MPVKKKSLISGKEPRTPTSFLDSLSEFSSEEDEGQQVGQQQPIVTTISPAVQPPQSMSTDSVPASPATSSDQSTNQTSELPSQDLSPSHNDISILLDEIATNVRDINTKVNRYNELMEKMYEYLKARYSNSLTDDNMDALKNFLISACCTSKPYSPPLICTKHKLIQDNGDKACSKKRKTVNCV